MTTIIYDHKARQIACDSRVSGGGVILSESEQKWRHVGADLLFFSGATCDIETLINNYKRVDDVDVGDFDCSAIMVRDGRVYLVGIEGRRVFICPTEFSRGIGSGGYFALSALDFGLSAVDAVKYATTRDCYSGGNIAVYDIESARFL